ncbi:hypothetical protein ACIQB5_48650, partial [Streptomyces sp. NPDC088560]
MSNWADLTTGQRIKHLRGSDLTQQGLAEAAGVSYALELVSRGAVGQLLVAGQCGRETEEAEKVCAFP